MIRSPRDIDELRRQVRWMHIRRWWREHWVHVGILVLAALMAGYGASHI